MYKVKYISIQYFIEYNLIFLRIIRNIVLLLYRKKNMYKEFYIFLCKKLTLINMIFLKV
jgi:hypothetical protein